MDANNSIIQNKGDSLSFYQEPKNILAALYGKERIMPVLGQPLLSGSSKGAQFVASDYSSIERAGIDLVHSLAPPHQIVNLTDVGNAVGYQAYGTASGLNLLLGLLPLKSDLENCAYSKAIGDFRGTLIGSASVGRDIVYAGSGATFLPYRVLSIIGQVHRSHVGNCSLSLLGRITSGFMYAGLVCYSIFFAFLAGTLGIHIYEGEKLRRKLSSKGLNEQVEILIKKLEVNPKKIEEKLKAKYAKSLKDPEAVNRAILDELKEEALKTGVQTLKALFKEMKVPGAPESKLREVLEALAKGPDEKTALKVLAARGLEIRADQLKLKKAAKLQRTIGEGALAEIRKAIQIGQLAERVSKGETSAKAAGQALVDQVYAGIHKNRLVCSLAVAITILGLAAMVAAMVLTGGMGAIVASALMLVFGVAMLALDAYFLKQSYRSEPGASFDKPLLAISSALCVLSLGSVIGLTIVGLMALGPFSIAVIALLTLLWLGQNGWTWVKINKNNERYALEHPTLDNFLDALKEGRTAKALAQMRQNLPKELQAMIEEALKVAQGASLNEKEQEAVRTTIKKVEALRRQELDRLREVLVPLLVN